MKIKNVTNSYYGLGHGFLFKPGFLLDLNSHPELDTPYVRSCIANGIFDVVDAPKAKPAPAPVVEEPVPAQVVEEPVPAPVVEEPAPVVEAEAEEQPKPRGKRRRG